MKTQQEKDSACHGFRSTPRYMRFSNDALEQDGNQHRAFIADVTELSADYTHVLPHAPLHRKFPPSPQHTDYPTHVYLPLCLFSQQILLLGTLCLLQHLLTSLHVLMYSLPATLVLTITGLPDCMSKQNAFILTSYHQS